MGLYLVKAQEVIEDDLLDRNNADEILGKINKVINAVQDQVKSLERKLDKGFVQTKSSVSRIETITQERLKDIDLLVSRNTTDTG
jgi:fructose-1,6-bisphosphatase